LSKRNLALHVPARVQRKARPVKLLLLDVDGVLTDGGIVMSDSGEEIKRFDVRDGQGIKLLQDSGITVALITGRLSKAVSRRARDLGIVMVYQGVSDKLDAYAKIKAKSRCRDHEIAYVGDDVADLPVLRRVGFAITVDDGWTELKSRVDYVTRCKGGRGAVREVAELLLRAQRRWEELLPKFRR
jgi:3-deoxy-D-manno-octulosonate 8-phosphate phosphatase (KDO 8-P phosphatase)